MGHDLVHLGAQGHADRRRPRPTSGLSLPITGAIKELVKDARRIKATERAEVDGNPGS
jgi:hypothetical protein